jgi:hypothetical protein
MNFQDYISEFFDNFMFDDDSNDFDDDDSDYCYYNINNN